MHDSKDATHDVLGRHLSKTFIGDVGFIGHTVLHFAPQGHSRKRKDWAAAIAVIQLELLAIFA